MATEKQIQANRNNAKQSTGPRTEEGKARVSQNALKHGLLARDAVMPGEDPAEFEAQLAALEADIQPQCALECELVRQIADAQWRMRRLTRIESGYLAASLENHRHLAEGPRSEESSYEQESILLGSCMFRGNQGLVHLARYDAHLGRRFERAIQQIAKLREAREKRHAAEANQANNAVRRPAGPASGANPRPSHGASPKPAHILEPQPSPPESNRQTKPIPPNRHEINELGTAIRAQSHPAPAVSQQVALQPGLGESRHNHNIAAGTEPNHPRGPLPDQN